ncbi:hypothetical protein CCP3SC15_310023 [Gammaproteobacteria bacterium]
MIWTLLANTVTDPVRQLIAVEARWGHAPEEPRHLRNDNLLTCAVEIGVQSLLCTCKASLSPLAQVIKSSFLIDY